MKRAGTDIVGHLLEIGYVKVSGASYFSTMIPGGVWHVYAKGERRVVYGLSEHDKPPTLISPRPRGCFDDDTTNRALSFNSARRVYAAMWNPRVKMRMEARARMKLGPVATAWRFMWRWLSGEMRRSRIRARQNRAVLDWLRMDVNAETRRVRARLAQQVTNP